MKGRSWENKTLILNILIYFFNYFLNNLKNLPFCIPLHTQILKRKNHLIKIEL